MYCPECGHPGATGAFCGECGSALPATAQAPAQAPAPAPGPVVTQSQGNGLAVAGFVLGLCGILVFAIPLGITALVLGGVARSRTPSGLATAAIVIGIIDIVLGIILIASIGRVF